MKRNNGFVLNLFLLLLTNCSAYQMAPLTVEHPAHPDAQPAPARSISRTLAYTAADIPTALPVTSDAAQDTGGGSPHEMRAQAQETVVGEGKVIATVPNANQVVIDHGQIKGFMDAMTMGYQVNPPSLVEGLKSGDKIRFTIDVQRKTIIRVEKLSDK
ncbi:MAG: copper-binding protein [Alphaproteobacteria bacterium]